MWSHYSCPGMSQSCTSVLSNTQISCSKVNMCVTLLGLGSRCMQDTFLLVLKWCCAGNIRFLIVGQLTMPSNIFINFTTHFVNLSSVILPGIIIGLFKTSAPYKTQNIIKSSNVLVNELNFKSPQCVIAKFNRYLERSVLINHSTSETSLHTIF